MTLTNGVNVSTPTTTTVTSSQNPSTYGQAVTFTATVAQASGSAIPTGSVVFTIDGAGQPPATLNGSGQATYTTSTLTAGSHTVSAAYTHTGNFTDSSGSLSGGQTVNPRPITVKANAVSRVYGDSTPAATLSVTVGTLASGDTLASLGTPIFSTTPANPGVGTFPITVSGLSNANYTITYDNAGLLTVTPRPITIKASAVSRVYGDSTPAFSISLSVGTLGYSDNLASLGTASFSTDPNPVSGLTPSPLVAWPMGTT